MSRTLETVRRPSPKKIAKSGRAQRPAAARLVARHRVRELLEKMILSGRYPAGSKLVQEDLAQELGVAKGVVREALFELRGTGLVEAFDNRGMFVAPLSTRKLLESYELREVCEGLAARLCCRRITRLQIDELRGLAQRIYELGKQGKIEEGAQLDKALHQRLIEIADNSELRRMLESFVVLSKVVSVGANPKFTLTSHLALLNAIESGDADVAEQRMREHQRAGRRVVEQQITDGSFKPRWLI